MFLHNVLKTEGCWELWCP